MRLVDHNSAKPGSPARAYFEEQYRKAGFSDAMKGLYWPEHYAKGWARDAYREGKEQYMIFKHGKDP